jgi:glycosyltransferase involved in cell wall biosynthesis
LNDSLTILLPVQNAAPSLARSVETALEVAVELTRRFEIAIVDDGSTDGTEEIACDLAIRYPQVIVARHSEPRGRAAAIETGIAATTGTIILVQPQDLPLQPVEMRRLWNVGIGYNTADAGAQATPLMPGQLPRPAGVIARLVAWGQALRQAHQPAHGVQMIRRNQFATSRPPLRRMGNRVDRGRPIITVPQPSALVQARDFALGE